MSDDKLWELFTATDLGTLATIRKDGRPQLSDVNYTPSPGLLRISTRTSLAKTHNLRRDPRASIRVGAPGGFGYAVADVTAELTDPARHLDDPVVEELIDIYRSIGGKEHPDWADYRRAMLADGRLVLRLHVTRLYGWS
jgi:PPOX class probable F420-dependent enzyme